MFPPTVARPLMCCVGSRVACNEKSLVALTEGGPCLTDSVTGNFRLTIPYHLTEWSPWRITNWCKAGKYRECVCFWSLLMQAVWSFFHHFTSFYKNTSIDHGSLVSIMYNPSCSRRISLVYVILLIPFHSAVVWRIHRVAWWLVGGNLITSATFPNLKCWDLFVSPIDNTMVRLQSLDFKCLIIPLAPLKIPSLLTLESPKQIQNTWIYNLLGDPVLQWI